MSEALVVMLLKIQITWDVTLSGLPNPVDEGTTIFRNVGNYLTADTV
jgi:hypothetical protein